MKKAMTLCGSILLLIIIGSLLAGAVSAEEIIIDTEKGVPGFRSEPARDLPGNWQYVHDHPETSADGWFDINAYPPGQGNGSFWYTISFPDMGECKGIWETSVPYTGKYEVFAWIPSPDPFDPYLDESTPPSDYLPTKRAPYKVFHNGGVDTVTIDQNVNMGRFTSLGVFVFDSTARVELSSNGVEFWRCVAFDAVKFVPVVHDIAVTDVSIMPPTTSVEQSTAICVTVTNEGSQQEANVSVKAFVDGAQVGPTKYVALGPGSSDTRTFLWIPHAAKNYSVEGVVGIVSGETDTDDNRKAIEVGVLTMPKLAPIFDEIPEAIEENGTQRSASETYTFVTMWPAQLWYFCSPVGIAVDNSGYVYVVDSDNSRIQKFDAYGNFITKWGSAGTGDGEFDWPYGIAVDSSGNVYVADSGNHRIQKFDADGNFITKWGSYGTGDGEFGFSNGIAVDSSGNVYVSDLRNHRIQKFNAYGNFITKWGSYGTGDGEFNLPGGIAVDSSDYVYVVDSDNNRIQKFDSNGNFITKWGNYGTGDGEFGFSNGIAVDSSGYVYVADSGNDRIQKFDAYGNFITKWGSYGLGNGEFYYPWYIAVDSSGTVYVTDSNNNRIQKFDADGNFITKWGSRGSGEGEFYHHRGIAVDSSAYVYVADSSNHRIQKFDSNGNFITKWGSTGGGDGQFGTCWDIAVDSRAICLYVVENANCRIQKFDSDGNFITKWGSYGNGDGEFNWPRGIAVDSSGNVYVADTDNDRIQKFDSDGNFITKWGSFGSGDGEFGSPCGIAVDSRGYVYVLDTWNHRIQKFDSVGNFITKWGSYGTGEGEFLYPWGIAVDSSGNVYVADPDNHRIQKFDSVGNFITKWGSYGTGNGEFRYPYGAVVDSSGYVYVADTGNNRMQKFAPKSAPRNPPYADPHGPYSGNVNEPIQFYGDGTPAMGRTIVAYEWTFDGVPVTEQNPTHTYSDDGTYVATLRVQDSAGLWSPPKECKVYVVEPFTFVQVTDMHIGCKYVDVNLQCEDRTEMSMGWFTSVINRINNLAPEVDFVLVTGDLVESDEPDFFYKFMDVLTRLDSSIRFYHIPGNHDRYTIYGFGDDLTNYHDCVLINGPRQILIGPDNYTFEYGGYTFIGLDSGADTDKITYQGTGLTAPQIYGLRTHEVTHPGAPRIIFMHHPVFNDYNWGIIRHNRKPFITYCRDNKVQLVLTGHTHEAKIFNANGKRVGWNSNDRPLFIQTGSVTEHSEYRVIEVNGYDDISIWPSSDQPIYFKKSIWSDGSDKSVLHVYDSQGRHTGIDGSGNIVNEIPHSFYIGNYGPMNLEGIILYDDTEDYKLTVTLKDGSIQPLDGKLQQPENQSFNLTITNQTGDSLTSISYNNMTFTENTTATVNLNRTAVNYTMAIDYTGNNITDETKDPDSIETDYAPTATINTPVNNSIYRYGDQIVFNGTGIDIEDGILTNSSLFWSSTLDGFIGIGCECNTTNLTAGTHIIALTVNDSSGQTNTDNVTLTVIAPDLAVTNIAFSNPQPTEGDTVTINATIGNNGTANAADVIVQFFDGTPANGTQIGANQTIATLNAGENGTVSVVWDTTGEAGDNCIWVVADPADTIKEPDEENNQASKNTFVGAPTVLHITEAQTDRAAYLGNEAVLISCIVQNASGNISANVSAEIAKPDSGTDNITLAEGLVGYYYGTFTNTSLSGCYNVTIYANRTGFVGDTESLCFDVLDTTPPASVTNITNTSGPTWINWTWDNPLDPDFDHTLIYLNGSWKTATAEGCYLADGLNATSVYEIATRTVDADGNINATWVNQTAATISPCFIATAAYGTALHEDIDVLRDFRDEYLMPNPAGRAFVKIYYNVSPPLADVIRENEGLRTAVREGLVKPLVDITRRLVE